MSAGDEGVTSECPPAMKEKGLVRIDEGREEDSKRAGEREGNELGEGGAERRGDAAEGGSLLVFVEMPKFRYSAPLLLKQVGSNDQTRQVLSHY